MGHPEGTRGEVARCASHAPVGKVDAGVYDRTDWIAEKRPHSTCGPNTSQVVVKGALRRITDGFVMPPAKSILALSIAVPIRCIGYIANKAGNDVAIACDDILVFVAGLSRQAVLRCVG